MRYLPNFSLRTLFVVVAIVAIGLGIRSATRKDQFQYRDLITTENHGKESQFYAWVKIESAGDGTFHSIEWSRNKYSLPIVQSSKNSYGEMMDTRYRTWQPGMFKSDKGEDGTCLVPEVPEWIQRGKIK